jgi:hypothetical protein
MKINTKQFTFCALTALLLSGCKKTENTNGTNPDIQLKVHSVTPSLVVPMAGFENLEILPLISSEDKLTETPNFIYGAQPDGAGLMKNPGGEGYVMINNHEILFSVSRVYLDKNF